jgi:wyosine [tRNA(Phe)-imidazoG37] synthetase (radical SAM superfamily)
MATVASLHSDHSRLFTLAGRPFRSVYPVLSRRSGGISVGINLNLDKGCNFDCIYCQVDRTVPGMEEKNFPLLESVMEEIGLLFQSVDSGEFFGDTVFGSLSPEFRVVKDIAFSGDGEPTLAPSFLEVSRAVRQFLSGRDWTGGTPPLLRLITNGSGLFSRETRLRTREIFLQEDPGEIWLKLDAADRERFAFINRSRISFERMMQGLDQVVADLPVTIQTMILDYGNPGEQGSFTAGRDLWDPLLERVSDWSRKGAQIRAWHLYSVARPPAVTGVRKVSADRLEAWAREAAALPFPVIVFP